MKIEDYNKYYIQGSDHYLIPKYVFMELFNEMVNWREEAKELKKQLTKKVGNDELISKINLTPETATIQASKVNINGAEQTCDILLKSILEENKKLKDNWIKLKRQVIDSFNKSQDIQFLYVLEDMQELEKGSGSNEI